VDPHGSNHQQRSLASSARVSRLAFCVCVSGVFRSFSPAARSRVHPPLTLIPCASFTRVCQQVGIATPVLVHQHHIAIASHSARLSVTPASLSPDHPRKSARPLVPVSSTHCCASTSGLSNGWSSRGLTLSRDRASHLGVGFPLRCFQRFSAPQLATRPCRWHDNRHTSAASTPVLSY
jgi:hypothetical protein